MKYITNFNPEQLIVEATLLSQSADAADVWFLNIKQVPTPNPKEIKITQILKIIQNS